MNELKVVLQNGHIILKSARATHHLITDDIVLYLPNILKDVECNCEELAEAIDHLVLIEIICSIATQEINHNQHLCEGKRECPINKILRKVELNYELNLPCKNESTHTKEVTFAESDVIPKLFC